MNPANNKQMPQQPEDNDTIRETISTFEAMLELFPEDISALESLLVAYQQAGDDANLCDKGNRLISIFMLNDDWNRVFDLAQTVLAKVPDDVTAKHALQQAQERTGRVLDEAHKAAGEVDLARISAELGFDLHGELDLAWLLLQNAVISQEQYESAIDRLTEISSHAKQDCILSFLEELKEVDRVDMVKVVAFIAAEGGMPFIELSRCEFQEEVVNRIPFDYARHIAAIPFDRFGNEIMVAVMNPVNKNLHQRIAKFLKTNIHFFFTSPDEFHAASERYKERTKKKS